MHAGKHREIHDVVQTIKVATLIARETTFGQHVCELILGVNKFDLDFGVRFKPCQKKQSNATLWVLDTCLIVGLLPFMIILITASLSSKIYNCASYEKNVRL